MPDLQKAGRLAEGQRIANVANLYYVPFAPPHGGLVPRRDGLGPRLRAVPNLLVLEWQIYFHRNPMFEEIVTLDGPAANRARDGLHPAPPGRP
jgi:galactonate dehydratase